MARRTAYRIGFRDGRWLDLTPGELAAHAMIFDEAREQDWRLQAWLARQIPRQVWAPKTVGKYDFPYSLLLPPEPPAPRTEEEARARAERALKDALEWAAEGRGH